MSDETSASEAAIPACPRRASAYAGAAGVEWEPAGEGMRVKRLYADDARGERTLLFEMAPGARSAPHAHDALEQIYVLEGAFHDGERLLRAGDYCCRGPGAVHESYTEHGALVLVTYTPG